MAEPREKTAALAARLTAMAAVARMLVNTWRKRRTEARMARLALATDLAIETVLPLSHQHVIQPFFIQSLSNLSQANNQATFIAKFAAKGTVTEGEAMVGLK